MNTFVINGKTYTAKKFSFNTICSLEDKGVSVDDMQKKPVSTARAYFAVCAGLPDEKAGDEIEQHILNGGNLDEMMEKMVGELNNSDFFRAAAKEEKKVVATKKTSK